MQLTVTQVYFSDDWQSSHGPMKGWYFGATTQSGEEGLFTINTKPTNTLIEGVSFDFEPAGGTVQKNGYEWQKGKRANKPGPNPYGGQQPLRVAGNAPQGQSQQPARKMVELEPAAYAKQRASLIALALSALTEALGSAGDDATVTEIAGYIGRDMADALGVVCVAPQPKPQPLPMRTEPPGYAPAAPPPQGGDDDIPF